MGFDTIINAAAVLNLTSDRIASNLIRYISGIVEPLHGYRTSYFNSFLKERLLNEYVYDATSAIFAADPAGRIIYHNRRAAELFQLDRETASPRLPAAGAAGGTRFCTGFAALSSES